MNILGALWGFLLLSSAATTTATRTTPPILPSYTVAMTAYNAVPAQTDDNPLETASGAYSNPEVIAARSQDLGEQLPFGTIVEIDGPAKNEESCGYGVVAPLIGYRVIADTMNARYANRIDVLFDTKSNYTMRDGTVQNAADIAGVCHGVTVRVVGRLNINHMPKTQKELAAIVDKSSIALAVK